jgi:rhodanese-related sulfurtransferase
MSREATTAIPGNSVIRSGPGVGRSLPNSARQDQRPTYTVCDIKSPGEFADGFVPGAVNVPRGLIEFRIWKLVGFPDNTRMDTKMTLYCATGGRCALATKSLQDLGFTNATSVDMRFDDWVKAGHPVAKPK